MSLRLADLARRVPEPSAAALIQGEESLSYGALDQQADAFAASLVALGFRPGDRLLLLLPASFEFVIAFLGAQRVGVIVIALNPLISAGELHHVLETMRPAGLVSPPPSMPLPAVQALPALAIELLPSAVPIFTGLDAAEAKARHPGGQAFSDLIVEAATPQAVRTGLRSGEAVVLFTSGTTGTPKGVSLSEESLMANARTAAAHVGVDRGDVVLCPLPLSHVFGLVVALIGGLSTRATIVLIPRPAPDQVHAAMVATSPTLMFAAPATLAGVLRFGANQPKDLTWAAGRRLRAVATGGAPLALDVAEGFAAQFNTVVFQGYGMTETAGLISIAEPSPGAPRDVGRVQSGLEFEIAALDPNRPGRGELKLRGPGLLLGIYVDGVLHPRHPETWYSTGDLVELDDQGRMVLFDRSKDLILRGGYNVYPSEVEAVLADHPKVAQAAVIGVNHAELGQEVAAFVALRPGDVVDAKDLVAWCRDRLSRYKYPRRIAVMETLPTSPAGKVLKRELPVDHLIALD